MKIYQVFNDGEIVLTTKDTGKALRMVMQMLDQNGLTACVSVLESEVK